MFLFNNHLKIGSFLGLFLLLGVPLNAQFDPDFQLLSERLKVRHFAHGDIDQDGDVDLVATMTIPTVAGARLVWIENWGNGRHQFPHFIQKNNSEADRIFLEDLNNDGLPDIIFEYLYSPFTDERLVWKPNLGNSQFGPEQILTINAPGSLVDIILTDLDNDNLLDIISITPTEIQRRENDGNGNFTTTEILLTDGFSNNTFAFADLDGDLDQDLLRWDLDEGLLWLENVNGQLTTSHFISSSISTIVDIVTLDADQDMDQDVIILGGSTEDILLLENTDGNGSFAAAQAIDTNLDDLASLKLSDIDADGDLDLATSPLNANGIYTYENLDNSIAFGTQTIVLDSISGINDFKFDALTTPGQIDLTIVRDNETEVKRFSNFTWQNPNPESNTVFDYLNTARSHHFQDMDNDGDLDCFVPSRALSFLENLDGLGSFSAPINIRSNESQALVNAELFDMDNDGDLDVAAAYYDHGIKWYENLGGMDQFGPAIEVNNFPLLDLFILFDADGDGDMDILTGYDQTPYRLVWIENDNQAFTTEHLILESDWPAGNLQPYDDYKCVDWEGDGDVDIILGSGAFVGDLFLFENDNGNFTSKVLLSDLYRMHFDAGDINNDGRIDIALFPTPNGWDQIGWFEYNQNFDTLVQKEAVNNLNTSFINDLYLGDVDDNGNLDLFMASLSEDKLLMFRNFGGSFGPKEFISGNVLPFNSYFATKLMDINNDNLIDITALSNDNSRLVWFENLGNTTLLTGTVFWDENENGIQDSTEIGLFQQAVSLDPTAVMAWTNPTGQFLYYVSPNDYLVNLSPIPGWHNTTPLSLPITVDADPVEVDFGLIPDSLYYNGELHVIAGPARCGFLSPFWVNTINTGTLPVDGALEVKLDTFVAFDYAIPPPDSIQEDTINGNTLYWSFNDLTPTYTESIKVYLRMPGVNFIDSVIHISANVVLLDTMQNGIIFDTATYTSRITCAYDPNDKLVEPNIEGFPNYTLFGDTLLYTVRFQNTGNDTAFNVRIDDQLDPNLDWSSFEAITASHPFNTELRPNGKVSFYFNDILLPDSTTNEPESHGFVQYRISPKDGLEENTLIANEASIFFDFNPPIITNTVVNVMVSQYPLIYLAKDIVCGNIENGSIQPLFILDDLSYSWSTGDTTAYLNNLSAGNYDLLVSNSNGQIVLDTSFLITAPPPLSSTPYNIYAAVEDIPSGYATVFVSGGTPPYSFEWDTDPVQFDSIATDLFASSINGGPYYVTITDNNGCIRVDSVWVDIMGNTNSSETQVTLSIFPNPSSGQVTIQLDRTTTADFKLTIHDQFGRTIAPAFLNQVEKNQWVVNGLQSGIYFVQLIWQNGKAVRPLLIFDD